MTNPNRFVDRLNDELERVRASHVPEQASVPPMPKVEYPQPSQLITITVAEYHFLTKAATLLEVILADKTYGHENVVEAVRNTVEEMQRMAEAGAEE